MKTVQIPGYFWSAFSCIQSEYRKIRIRNNFVSGKFSRSNDKIVIQEHINFQSWLKGRQRIQDISSGNYHFIIFQFSRKIFEICARIFNNRTQKIMGGYLNVVALW